MSGREKGYLERAAAALKARDTKGWERQMCAGAQHYAHAIAEMINTAPPGDSVLIVIAMDRLRLLLKANEPEVVELAEAIGERMSGYGIVTKKKVRDDE